MLNDSFFEKLSSMSRSLGINPKDLLLVMYMESGVNPSIKNKEGATGLIQFMPDTLKGFGLNSHEIANFKNQSAEKQLDYVEKYIKGKSSIMKGKPFTSAIQYYHANYFPLTLTRWHGDDPRENANVVITSSRAKSRQERAAYASNKGLDANKDGKITVGDIAVVLGRKSKESGFQELLSRLNKVSGGVATKPNHKSKTINPGIIQNFISGLEKIVNNFLGLSSTSSMDNNPFKKIATYKYMFPCNKMLILVGSNDDFSSSLEYSRILCLALKEELDAETCIHTNGKDIEIECEVHSSNTKAVEATRELCNAVSLAFKDATKKIGEVKTFTVVIANSKSDHEYLSFKTAELNYRKFHIKFLKH